MTVVPVGEKDWAQFRELWLRVRAERPGEFLDAFAEAAAQHESLWRTRLASAPRCVTFAVVRDERFVGTLGAYIDDEAERVAYLQHALVSAGSDTDDQAVIDALWMALVVWADLYDVDCIVAEVHEDADQESRRFSAQGFAETQIRRPSHRATGGTEVELRYAVPRLSSL